MNKTFGVLAHVDAGKTTFSEQLLYHMGATSSLLKVDDKTSCLDNHEIEQNRGITIFAEQSAFTYNNHQYFLIDTPGHMDFSAETERTIRVMDYAILIINGTSGVEAHTLTLFRLLKKYKIPVFFFLNKMDMPSANRSGSLSSIKTKLSKDSYFLNSIEEIEDLSPALVEFACEYDDSLLVAYLTETMTAQLLADSLKASIKKGVCFLSMEGSAIKGEGVTEFFQLFDLLTDTYFNSDSPFLGSIYKIRHDLAGNPITFMKSLAGTLKVKQSFIFPNSDIVEKVNEIRTYEGNKFTIRKEVSAGTIFAVTGLKTPGCGTLIGSEFTNLDYDLIPTLEATIHILDQTSQKTALEHSRELEAEDPKLSVVYREETKELCVSVMGPIQLEVLQQLFMDRFGMKVAFSQPKVLYKETIAKPIMGYGHFEPLRHYAEVNLLIEPGEAGTGITFESKCHVDTLASNYQNLVKTHVFERVHKGILTGSPLTDVKITLICGRAHIKHTEGGDFREATYRAIRQGLEKAENKLLEPFYHFDIFSSTEYVGRIMSDITKGSGTFDPPIQSGNEISISGRGPVASFMNYSSELLSFTKGMGTISLYFDGYDQCHNPEEVMRSMAYDKGADAANTSCSVFCSHGTSFVVNWDEAEKYMHCIE